jgi:beta-glucosidase
LVDKSIYKSLFNQCQTNGAQGFAASYWDNKTFSGKTVAEVTQTTPFTFQAAGATAFAAGVPIEGFSAKYTTTFTPNHSGEAIFRLSTNGGVKISVNGEEVNETVNVKQPTNAYSLAFNAGQSYNIEIQFEQIKGDAFFNFDLVEIEPVDLAALLKRIKKADVVVFAGGISALLEGEQMFVDAPGFKGGDRTDIELPQAQRDILKAIKDAGKKLIFVNYSGSAMGLSQEVDNCDAILQAWYPGQEGGTAVADVLFGNYNPSGRLPITFYKNVDQLPDFEDYSMAGRTYRYFKGQPQFAFGYGLSYTKFKYGQASLDKSEIGFGETVTMTIPVSNIGKRDGEEVVQVYLRRVGDTEGPSKTLRGYSRVNIAKGGTAQVEIPLDYHSFDWFDTTTNTMRPIPGSYELLYGGASDNLTPITITVK